VKKAGLQTSLIAWHHNVMKSAGAKSSGSRSPYPRRLAHGLTLLYEDRDILVVDKPAGLLSIASGTERDKTAYWILSEYLRRKGEKRRAAVVHRLDRDTSGVMLFAKSEIIKRKLMETWDTSVTERRYVALAEGVFTEDEGIIDAPLGEDRRGRVAVVFGGQRAVTHWRLLKTGGGLSLLSLELETGRRNQIRAHLDWLGHPVAGDKKYSAKTDPLNRLCLHAERLVFRHPHDGRVLEFEVKAPAGFYRS
jgi:23S rRNA pseudouridine1911/1915/1917 synthase